MTSRKGCPRTTGCTDLSTFTPHFNSSLIAQIPRATALAPALEDIGLSPSIARQLSDVYLHSSDKLHDVCQASLLNAFMKASATKSHVSDQEIGLMAEDWTAIYVQQTRAWADDTLSRAREVVKLRTSVLTPRSNGKKPVFNHEYTSLLKKYFLYNAYPSAPDRAVLARKSMMTPRQIEVWFQNHRNRAKKEGKALRKLAKEPLPSEISLNSLEQEMPFFIIPETERKVVQDSELVRCKSPHNKENQLMTKTSSAPTIKKCTFPNLSNSPCPSHVFPAIYVNRDEDIFAIEPGIIKFPSPLWHRKPATRLASPQERIDMNNFTLEFSQKLHLRVPEGQGHHPTSPSWCAGRYIPLLRAPHPALIRSTIASPISCSPHETMLDRCSDSVSAIRFQPS